LEERDDDIDRCHSRDCRARRDDRRGLLFGAVTCYWYAARADEGRDDGYGEISRALILWTKEIAMRPVSIFLATIAFLCAATTVVSAFQASSRNGGPLSPSTGTPAAPAGAAFGGHGHHHGGHGGGGVVVDPYAYWPYTIYPYPSPYPYPDAPYSPNPPTGGGVPPPPNDASNDMPPGPFWYFCDQPNGYYPYVKSCGHDWTALPIAPPPPGTGAPVSDGTWSWCDDPKGYFPYVAKCRRKWKPVPVTIPLSEGGPDSVPITADWFYCDDPAGYMPYVATCAKDWRAVPSIPPPNAANGIVPIGD
jgi:hypothetical protein